MMNHWLVMPVLLPAVLGPLIVMWMRRDLILQRVFSVAGTVALLGVSVVLLWYASLGEVIVYRMGNWAAPFGITLVLDRLSAMMVFLTAVLALCVQLYAIGSGWDRKGWHFHALWQFQLMGVCGSFMTGDAFNLFVFFEILLIASYGLTIHGGGEMRLRAGFQYVVYNLVGSTLFLVALGTIYSVTGTLNMADLAERVAMLPASDTALVRAGAVLLMMVFAVKAALVPLHFWLPSTYADAPGPVAALFAIMTKVGVYCLIRFFTLVFPHEGTTGVLISEILLPVAIATLVIGQLGVLGGRSLSRVASYAAIGSIGTLVIAVAPFAENSTAAALWYLPHSVMASAALFLVADLVGARRGGDVWLRPLPPFAQSGLVAALFFAVAIAVVGLPPLSGFPGKLLVMDAFTGHPWQWWVWGFILVTSLLAMIGFIRTGTMLFWKSHEVVAMVPAMPDRLGDPNQPLIEPDEASALAEDALAPTLALTATCALIGILVAITLAAGPLAHAAEKTAAQLHQPALYIDAVLRNQGDVR